MVSIPLMIYRNKFQLPALPPLGTFKNQTILITGGTGGLGLATAVHFVNLGARTVFITGRNEAKCQIAKTEIERQTNGKSKDVLKTMELDMSTFVSVKTFADKVKKEISSIDYVLLNAGMLNKSFKLGKEGFEETIEVNTLSTTLLAILLLPWMKVAGHGNAHLGIVGSGRHRGVDIKPPFPQTDILAHFAQTENYPGDMYPCNKLFLEYCMLEISKLALGPDEAPRVIVNTICPGMTKSDLGRDYKTNMLMSYAVDTFMTMIAKSSEGGARTLVRAALTTKEENGVFYTDYTTRDEYAMAAEKNITGPEGKKIQAQVWKEVIAVLGERIPEVRELVGA